MAYAMTAVCNASAVIAAVLLVASSKRPFSPKFELEKSVAYSVLIPPYGAFEDANPASSPSVLSDAVSGASDIAIQDGPSSGGAVLRTRTHSGNLRA